MPCLSYAPGHNVHWIQARANEWTSPAIVVASPDADADLPWNQQVFTLYPDTGSLTLSEVRGRKGRKFVTHSALALRVYLQLSGGRARYSEDRTLLLVERPDRPEDPAREAEGFLQRFAAFYPNFAPATERVTVRCQGAQTEHAKRGGYSYLTVDRLEPFDDE